MKILLICINFGLLLAQETTTSDTTEETTTELPTTTETPTTTEDPANFPKTGEVELLVEDICYSCNMIAWSSSENYLVLADIWGQKYIRFREKDPVTTTIVPDTTTQADVERFRRQAETTTESETTTLFTTTELPTTTAEPLPYDIHHLIVPADVVFLIRPQYKIEGAYPLIVPLVDEYNVTGTDPETNVVIGFNDKLHVAQWNLSKSLTNLTYNEWSRNNIEGRIPMKNFMVPSSAWIDPRGRLVTAAKEIRPFENKETSSRFYVFFNSMEAEESFRELRDLAKDPAGMAWNMDNDTMYYSDASVKSIFKCSYDNTKAQVSDCSEHFKLSDTELGEGATPKGMALDTSDHLWISVANAGDNGAVIELDPESNTVISTIDVPGDSSLVDLVFAGEDLDFLYLASETNLYKIEGMGVTGRNVTGFIWQPDY